MQAARHILPEIPDLTLDFPVRRPAARPSARTGFQFRKVFVVILLLSAAALVNVGQKALIAQNNIDISSLKNSIAEEERTRKTLEVSRMVLQSPSRIERLAVARLDMRKPESVKQIVLPEITKVSLLVR